MPNENKFGQKGTKMLKQLETRSLLYLLWKLRDSSLNNSADNAVEIQISKANFDYLLETIPEHIKEKDSKHFLWGQELSPFGGLSCNVIKYRFKGRTLYVLTPSAPLYMEVCKNGVVDETGFKKFLKTQALEGVSDDKTQKDSEPFSADQIFDEITDNLKGLFPKNLWNRVDAASKNLKDRFTKVVDETVKESESILEELSKIDPDKIWEFLAKHFDELSKEEFGDDWQKVADELRDIGKKVSRPDNTKAISAYADKRIPLAFKHIVYGFTVLEHKNTLLVEVEVDSNNPNQLLARYGCGPVDFVATGNTLHELVDNFNALLIESYLRLSEETKKANQELAQLIDDPASERRLNVVISNNDVFLKQFRKIYAE